MSKFTYTYSVVAPSGRLVYAHDTDKGRTNRLLADLVAGGRTGFKLRQHRHNREV